MLPSSSPPALPASEALSPGEDIWSCWLPEYLQIIAWRLLFPWYVLHILHCCKHMAEGGAT